MRAIETGRPERREFRPEIGLECDLCKQVEPRDGLFVVQSFDLHIGDAKKDRPTVWTSQSVEIWPAPVAMWHGNLTGVPQLTAMLRRWAQPDNSTWKLVPIFRFPKYGVPAAARFELGAYPNRPDHLVLYKTGLLRVRRVLRQRVVLKENGAIRAANPGADERTDGLHVEPLAPIYPSHRARIAEPPCFENTVVSILRPKLWLSMTKKYIPVLCR